MSEKPREEWVRMHEANLELVDRLRRRSESSTRERLQQNAGLACLYFGILNGTARQDLVPAMPPLTVRLVHGGSMHSTEDIPYGHCHCGCGQQTTIPRYDDPKTGRVKGVPLRFVVSHHNRINGPGYVVEDRGYTTPCHISQYRTNRGGYAVRNVKGKTISIHRIAWEEKHGPIPDGLELDHLCRVRACRNPDHLEPVTKLENMLRGKTPKVTCEDVARIRAIGGSIRAADIGAMFGIKRSQVSNILANRCWKDVT